MNGIAPKPTPVVIHFLVARATWGIDFPRTNRDPAQILLIVNPGIRTEAKACQISVSKAAVAIWNVSYNVVYSSLVDVFCIHVQFLY